jgi:transcriptional regulator with XRE-family HTH domain
MSRPPLSPWVKDRRIEIGARLRKYRELAGLSQGEVAVSANIQEREVQRFESGEKSIPSEYLTPLASAVGTHPWFLLGDKAC